ncbi:MAG TPA: helix-turn-helix domain-containing protein [Burkholderiaceae bacterium]|nr:helix-turn-helix domain-containing protein [Burkholderiaceae bacterium]
MFDAQTNTATPTAPCAATACAPAQWTTMRFADVAAALGVALPADPRVADVEFPVRRIRPGQALHRAGDKFEALYFVRAGFFKTVSVTQTGAEQVLAFPMRGDVLGLDGVDPGVYTADVVALDTSHVVVIPFAQLAQLTRDYPAVERFLYCAFSRELTQKHGMIWLLGTLNAEARVAAFLQHMSESFGRLGYSRAEFTLRMTRQEIGSYLGLKLETVSRIFSAFAAAGLLEVERRVIRLLDLPALRLVIDPPCEVANRKRPVREMQARTVTTTRTTTPPRSALRFAPQMAMA